MSTLSSQTTSTVGWNGLQLKAPGNWETIVSGNNHLIFEDDFEPVLQLRWQTVSPLKARDWKKRSEQWWHAAGLSGKETDFPGKLKALKDKFTLGRYFKGKTSSSGGGVCYCKSSHTLLIFQLLTTDKKTEEKRAELLGSLFCHREEDTLWSIQDFSLRTPRKAKLIDYSFKAGLSRLSFSCDNYILQVCRLAQAAERLANQSLDSLLLTLAGTEELFVEVAEDSMSCHASRVPSISKQILLRLKKEKPFIEAKLWRVEDHDRILGAFVSAKSPIPLSEIRYCYETLQIVA